MSKKNFEVTPYEVKGEVDYEKIVKEFGLSEIDNKLLKRIEKSAGESHFMLRRRVFFAHRDLGFALDNYEKKNLFLYTGCGPSGPIHLGHAFVWEFVRWLQDKFDLELWFQFTDDEKFLYNKDKDFEEIKKWTYENMLDVIAIGFNPKKTHFLVDTTHSGIMYPQAIKVAKKITFSTIKASFGFTEQNNIGSIFYTAMQAVPAFLPSVLKKKKMACLIPHAVDQDTHFRLTRDILPKIGYYKPASIQSTFLPPLTGASGKMSSSKGASIFMTDSPQEVKKKINKYAFSGGQNTVEEHRKKGGNPDVDVSFQYLKMFFEPDDEKLKRIYDDYKSGKMLTSELKNILIDKINTFLKAHQKKRKKAKKRIDEFLFKS